MEKRLESSNVNEPIDLYHTAAMLSFGRINSFVLHGKPRIEFATGRGLPCENKAFYSPETQHGRRVIRVYQLHTCIQGRLTFSSAYKSREYIPFRNPFVHITI